ncbi:MAG: hypothetical protein M3430_08590 [Acidobacteriota bacterium]|nr:hypothetical protein [Acidobacteriota bacterium]
MSQAIEEFTPKEVIRTETALSRFPVHRLSKKGSISISIKVAKPNGELKTQWRVSYNSEYGQPSPLAYKLDTLIINQKIEEEGKPLPKLIRLGSLTEIAQQTGTGEKNTNAVKRALLQNAFAAIRAKFSYKTKSGNEAFAEIADTRYGVIFTGEKLPSGEKADAVYIVLHDIYHEILNNAVDRPLDFDYMKELTPGAQRFYELLSYQGYAALKNRTSAKMLYSEFCMYAPQTRYADWDHVKKQMYKLHRPHLAAQYIEKIHFEKIAGQGGEPDWLMIYVPGVRAKGQHVAFERKPIPRIRHSERNANQPTFLPEERPELFPDPVLTFAPEEERLVSELECFGVAEAKARRLVKTHREATEAQIAAYPYRGEGKLKKNAAGWLIAAIEGNYTLPVAYLEERERKQQATKAREGKAATEACPLCDSNGWRRIRTPEHPHGAMKRCIHDPKTEAKYADV